MSNLIVPVILSGGGGTRLWPLSTRDRPKQFLPLVEADQTMIEATFARTADRTTFSAPIIVGSAHHRAITERHIRALNIDGARTIYEPCPRNTAPAVALAALASPRDSVLLILPSDHDISNNTAFLDAVAKGAEAAREGWLVTLGIKPTGPETGYGYIELTADKAGASQAMRVSRFVEKPSRETAEAMLATGQFVWNAGIFLFTAGRYLDELGCQAPHMLAAVEAAFAGAGDGATLTPAEDLFGQCPSDSIDYAVMEKSDRVACVPADMGWSDVGSWDALYDLASTEESGNALFGDAVALDSTNSLIRAEEGVTVATYGIKDLIVVATPDAVIIVPRGESQKVKDLLAAVQQKERR